MTGLELPGLGSLVSAIKFLFESVSHQIEIPLERRRKWFDEHIEPSYRQLLAIHQDYTEQFQKALDLLENRRDLQEVVRILKADRPHLLLQRQETLEVLVSLRDYRMRKRRHPRVVLIFYDYVASVDAYLNDASPLPRATWYTYFINTLSDLIRLGQDPFEYDYEIGGVGHNAPKMAIEMLTNAVQINMPDAFQKVQVNYANLRAECLTCI